MSAGRDKKARTKERRVQVGRALVRRAFVREAMLARRAIKQARRRALKAKNSLTA